MAKKAKKTETVETPKVVEQPKVETPVMEIPKPKKDKWELKDRVYNLTGMHRPLSKLIKSADIYWFDEEKGYERELKYCENQRTCFVDEMKGDQRLSHVIFRNGVLIVPKEKTVLQKLLSIYHPMCNVLYTELKPEVKAASEVNILEMEIEVSKKQKPELNEREKTQKMQNLSYALLPHFLGRFYV